MGLLKFHDLLKVEKGRGLQLYLG
ncbi:UNVERIFIED_CONTAM: hypothetical protein GTU68_019978 [Idotea baltica]|nr:hypothetical protein [Idotea baltica]